MKKFLILGIVSVVVALATSATAQTSTNPPTFIKGDMTIQYNTRQNTPVAHGVKDTYTVNVNVCNSAQFHGTITDLPQLIEGWVKKDVTQKRVLTYDIAADLVNPKPNPDGTHTVRNVGRLFGTVPITSDGVYHYGQGSLVMDIIPMGQAAGFTSQFKGDVQGKPLNRPANWLDTISLNSISLTRVGANGKSTTVVLKKYDKMVYSNTELGAGPAQFYTAVTVSGEMLYDYDKNCWFFNNVSLAYAGHYDRITGTIRFVEPARGSGEYQFDVRVNEPAPSETAAFSAGPTDESAFFETDNTIPSLTGTMKYKDTLRGDTTMASAVTIDLKGNGLTKAQTMALCKMIIFSAVVPMNAD
jgi:hypothetical protein